jgi:hypothetical protein
MGWIILIIIVVLCIGLAFSTGETEWLEWLDWPF